MKNGLEGNFLENSGQDVTAEFMKGTRSFRIIESSLLKEPSLKLELDLTTVTDRMEFILLARRAKAFVDTKPSGQERTASIRCTKEQMWWDANAFASGVEWCDAERE